MTDFRFALASKFRPFSGGTQRFACLFIMLILTCSPVLATVKTLLGNKHLYDGETLVSAAGFPALIKYVEADKDKPLVIFVPGDAHLARIAYGFPKGNPQDFLAYWLNQAGYPFLGVSYPLENPVFSKTYPEYNIRDWGEQVAQIAAHTVAENGLSKHVIICGWSMGGKIAASVSSAVRKHGLTTDIFVAMSADPPVVGLLPKSLTDNIKMLPDGLADRKRVFPWFVNAIGQQSTYNGRTIIPRDVFLGEFIGNIPVGLMETGLVYRDGKFVHDLEGTLNDAEMLDFAVYPIPAVIHGDSPDDAENVLFDTSDWAFIRNRAIVRRMRGDTPYDKIPPARWQQIQQAVRTSGQYLTEWVQGNHFFFLGEIGARDAAQKIIRLHQRAATIK
ncbi:hypothetical protein [Hoeflea sp. TYP-13]|uniref:hypothetical protein n=1 Tax=Hoeflea sp. TYP-13 TaxID=3230023 RepID=UPI0034C69A92